MTNTSHSEVPRTSAFPLTGSGGTPPKQWMRYLAPALIAIPGLPIAIIAAYRATFAMFGRDQGIYQYVAWALLQGQKAYSDFRDINGPLPHLIHLVFMLLGGGDEHVFRTLDIAVSSVVFLFVGYLLAGTMGTNEDQVTAPRPPMAQRLLWALASFVVLMSTYLTYGWWQTTQRESFYCLLLLSSLALQIHAATPFVDRTQKRRGLFFVAAGVLGMLPFFGKPTCLLFPVGQAAVLLLFPPQGFRRRQALLAFGGGALIGFVFMLAFLVAFGSLPKAVEIIFFEVPRLYRYVWLRLPREIITIWGNGPRLFWPTVALAIATIGVMPTRLRFLPLRSLALFVLPLGGTFVFLLQGKGFPYHLHIVTGGGGALALAIAMGLVQKVTTQPRIAKALTLVGTAAFGVAILFMAKATESFRERWDVVGATSALRGRRAYFNKFWWGDFVARDLRLAGRFLRKNTEPHETVQMYGMDPYLLYLAQRKSATPYIYSFELDIESSLRGESGGRPDESERALLLALQAKHESELLTSLEAHPPAAFALIDRMPFLFPPDAEENFARSCPRASAWMHEHYALATRIGVVRVFLRKSSPSLPSVGSDAQP